MNIYLAARFSRKFELRSYAMDLTQLGHVVTSRWLGDGHKIQDDGGTSSGSFAETRVLALDDLSDLRRAQLAICFSEKPGSIYGRGGRHVEFGLAWALGIEVWVVGPAENIFHFLPGVTILPTWAFALRAVSRRADCP